MYAVLEPNRLSGKSQIRQLVQPPPIITGVLLDTSHYLTVHFQLVQQDFQEQSFMWSATVRTKLAEFLFNGMKVESLSQFSVLPHLWCAIPCSCFFLVLGQEAAGAASSGWQNLLPHFNRQFSPWSLQVTKHFVLSKQAPGSTAWVSATILQKTLLGCCFRARDFLLGWYLIQVFLAFGNHSILQFKSWNSCVWLCCFVFYTSSVPPHLGRHTGFSVCRCACTGLIWMKGNIRLCLYYFSCNLSDVLSLPYCRSKEGG